MLRRRRRRRRRDARPRPSCSRPCTRALEDLGRGPSRCCSWWRTSHWADRSTRDLLSFLFTRSFAGPVAVVASYRSDDLHRRHPLRAAVAEWARVPGVQRCSSARCGDARRAAGWCARCTAVRLARERRARRSSTGPRATPSSPRSWSVPPRHRPAGAARGPRRPAAGPPGPARRRRPRRWCAPPPAPGDGSPTSCWRRCWAAAATRSTGRCASAVEQQRAGARRRRLLRLPPRAARRGGLRRPAARRAGPPARGLRPRAVAAVRPRAPRPSSPATPARPTTWRPRCAPASRPATTRCPSAAPTRRRATTRRRWSCCADVPTADVDLVTLVIRTADAVVAVRPPGARPQAGRRTARAACRRTPPTTTGRVC